MYNNRQKETRQSDGADTTRSYGRQATYFYLLTVYLQHIHRIVLNMYMYMRMYFTAPSYFLYLLVEDWRSCRWAPHLVTSAPKSIAAWAYVNRGGGWSFSAMAATPLRAAAVGHERGDSGKG